MSDGSQVPVSRVSGDWNALAEYGCDSVICQARGAAIFGTMKTSDLPVRIKVNYLPTAAIAPVDLERRVLGWLGDDERRAFGRLIRQLDRREYLAAHALVRLCLSSVLDCEAEAVMISYASNGRPYVQNAAVSFSLSHCRGMVVCACPAHSDSSEVSLGVDVEPLAARHRMSEVAKILLNERECDWVMDCEDPEAIMLELWTVKEAVLKARRTGFQTGRAGSPFGTVVCERPSTVRIGDRDISRYSMQDATIVESQVVDDSHVVSIAVADGSAARPEVNLIRMDSLWSEQEGRSVTHSPGHGR
jgi:phosphopantetheinyl transferase